MTVCALLLKDAADGRQAHGAGKKQGNNKLLHRHTILLDPLQAEMLLDAALLPAVVA